MGGANGKEKNRLKQEQKKHKDKKSSEKSNEGMNDEYVRFIRKEQERRERE